MVEFLRLAWCFIFLTLPLQIGILTVGIYLIGQKIGLFKEEN